MIGLRKMDSNLKYEGLVEKVKAQINGGKFGNKSSIIEHALMLFLEGDLK